MNAPVRIRLGLVHLETNRDFLQIPGSYPDEEDLEDEELIQQQHAQGVFDLHRFLRFSFITASDRGAETPRFLLVQQQRETPARDPQDEAELPRDRRSQPPKARIHAVPRLHHRFFSLSFSRFCSVRRARRATNPPRR